MATKAVKKDSFGTRGSKFKLKILGTKQTGGFDLSSSELELLDEVARLLDEIDELRAAIGRDGISVPGSTGQARVHPALGEVRQHRLALGRLLAQLSLPDDENASLPSLTQVRGRKAAKTRWAKDPSREVQNNG
jgi:hypothetical protein